MSSSGNPRKNLRCSLKKSLLLLRDHRCEKDDALRLQSFFISKEKKEARFSGHVNSNFSFTMSGRSSQQRSAFQRELRCSCLWEKPQTFADTKVSSFKRFLLSWSPFFSTGIPHWYKCFYSSLTEVFVSWDSNGSGNKKKTLLLVAAVFYGI